MLYENVFSSFLQVVSKQLDLVCGIATSVYFLINFFFVLSKQYKNFRNEKYQQSSYKKRIG